MSRKILVLEDEANIRSFIVINLKRAGYETIEAGTGQDALDQIRHNPDIDVALLGPQVGFQPALHKLVGVRACASSP